MHLCIIAQLQIYYYPIPSQLVLVEVEYKIKNKEYGSLACIYKREVNKFYPIRIYYKLDRRMGCCATGDRKKPCQCKCAKQPCKCL